MTRQRLLFLGLAGLALLAATIVLSAGGVPTRSGRAGGAAAGASGSGTATFGAQQELPRVAAEGRIVTYPGSDVLLGTEEPGRLLRLTVTDNQPVRAGEVIAEIDARLLREALAELTAGIAESEAELTLARLELARREELGRREVVSAGEVDVTRRNLDIAVARRAALEARAAQLRTRIERTRIVAPISGTVVARHADAGELLEAGAPLVTIADLTRLRIEAEADESDAGRLSVGDPVTIRADGWGGREWSGIVEDVPTWVTTRALKSRDPARPSDTRVLPVKVAFTEPVPLKLGQTVELTIHPRRLTTDRGSAILPG